MNALKTLPLLVLLLTGCSPSDPLALLWARFRVENTQNFLLCGIPLGDLEDLTLEQTAQVLYYWVQGQCPVEFVLGLGIRNPNITSEWLVGLPLTLARLDYDVYLDTGDGSGTEKVQVATGLFTGQLGLPDTGEIVVLDLGLSFDAFSLLQVLGPEAVIELMLLVGGVSGNLRDSQHLGRLSLFAVPEVDSPAGSMVWTEGFWVGLDWTSGDKP